MCSIVCSQVDLVLLHMPLDVTAQWKGLEQALAQNLTRAIGISNFDSTQIAQLLVSAANAH
jgi:diketogulonate reductase-like aldo/keto reductase